MNEKQKDIVNSLLLAESYLRRAAREADAEFMTAERDTAEGLAGMAEGLELSIRRRFTA